MVRLLALVGLAVFAAFTDAQCASSEHPNCASWLRNGFCTSGAYTHADRQRYCPRSCSNSGCSVTNAPTSTVFVENSNCGKWSTDPTKVFCVTGTDALKQFHCKITCAYELAPTEACVVYYKKGSTVSWTRANKTTSLNSIGTDDTMLYAFVNDGATLNFYDAGSLFIKLYKGKGFFKLTGSERKFFCH